MARAQRFGVVGLALVAVLAASSAGQPPAEALQAPSVVPAPPPLAAAAPPPVHAAPAAPPLPALPPLPGSPGLPVPPPAVYFPAPPPPADVVPFVKPAEPPPAVLSDPTGLPQPAGTITEPVATLHRFVGKYLGGDTRRALVYVETGDGKAEVQSRPLVDAIPPADGNAKDEVKRAVVPAGRALYHDGRVFVAGPRELVVLDTECRPAWTFALPGNAANSERLHAATPAAENTIYITSRTDSPFSGSKPGRVYVLQAVNASQVGFAPGLLRD